MSVARMGRTTALVLSNIALVALAMMILAPMAWAEQTVSIFDVRKTLPLDSSEPVYHDFYINAGPEVGLKAGMYVSIVRKIPIHDPVQNKAQATLSVEVAKVKIIHTESHISVARFAAEPASEARPLLEYDSVMIGDELDLATVTMDAPKEPKKRRDPASTEPEESTTPASAEKSFPNLAVPGMLRTAHDDRII